MDWFLYDIGLHHERVKLKGGEGYAQEIYEILRPIIW